MVRKQTTNRRSSIAKNNVMDSIHYHEENIISTVAAASNRSDQITQRLEIFQQSFEKETNEDKRVQWIHNQKKLNTAVEVSLKSLCRWTKGMFESWDNQTSSESHILHWKIRNFVVKVCCRMNCRENERLLKHYHKIHEALINQMKEEWDLLESSQSNLENEIKMCSDSCLNQKLSIQDLKLQTMMKKRFKEKKHLREICDYSRSIDLIDDCEYRTLTHEMETMMDLNGVSVKSITAKKGNNNTDFFVGTKQIDAKNYKENVYNEESRHSTQSNFKKAVKKESGFIFKYATKRKQLERKKLKN